MKNGEPAVGEDLEKRKLHPAFKKELEKIGIRSVISIPIIKNDERIGVINFFYSISLDKKNTFTNELIANCRIASLSIIQLMDNLELRAILLKAFDAKQLSPLHFDLKKFLDPIIKAVGKYFRLPHIIIRRSYEDDNPNVYHVAATYGIPKNVVNKHTVTIEHRMASNLAYRTNRSKKDRFIYLTDIQNKDVEYDQKDLARQYNLNSLISYPFVVKKKFKGFIVYFSKDKEGFKDLEQRKFLSIDLNQAIENIYVLADTLERISIEYLRVHTAIDRLKEPNKFRSESNKAVALKYAAKSLFMDGFFRSAGNEFFKAAERMKKHFKSNSGQFVKPEEDKEFIIENYCDSAVSYAKAGAYDYCKDSFNSLTLFLSSIKFNPQHDFYFNKLIIVLDEVGIEHLASKVYIAKMNRKTKHYKFIFKQSFRKFNSKEEHYSKVVNELIKYKIIHILLISFNCFFGLTRFLSSTIIHLFWKHTSNYGERWGKWLVFTIGFLIVFAILYFPNPGGKLGPFNIERLGLLQFELERQFQYPVMDNFLGNLAASLFFSIGVATTLIFGDITPINTMAKIVVASEVLLGYAFFGVFISLVARKFLRK